MNPLLIVHWIAFLLVSAYGLYRFAVLVMARLTYVRIGKKVTFDPKLKLRFQKVWVNVFGQKKLLKDKKSGIIHIMMFYGFILVQAGTLDFFHKGLFPNERLTVGGYYPSFAFVQEVISLAILIAVAGAFYRRYIEKLSRLKRGFKSGLVLIYIAGLILTVLLGNGMYMIWHGYSGGWHEPVASMIFFTFTWIGSTTAGALFYTLWWVHLLILLSFLLYVPTSKHFHLLTAPINIFLNRTSPPGKLEPIVFDDESLVEFGVNKVENFTQKQLLDLYACVECGRCTNVCPAANTGKVLSPMHLITKMRDHLSEKAAELTTQPQWALSHISTAQEAHSVQSNTIEVGKLEVAATSLFEQPITDIHSTMKWHQETWVRSDKKIEDIQLIGDVITEEEIWACTTCRNCEDQCPVMNEHVDKIVDLRRYLVLTEGKMHAESQRAMMNIEKQGNPWGINRKDRDQWRTEIQSFTVRTVDEIRESGETFEYLFWVGSMGSYDKRSQKIAQSFARLMNIANISFAILGNKESNSGDTSRRLGNEFLFQELAQKNIAEFLTHKVTKIVTIDPHAYHTLKNEYPDFGFKVEVYHHTEALAEWVREGRLKPKFAVNETITFHDSCYLGRYNEVYDPPRDILRAIPGVNLVEMHRNRENGMCCGAGGGMMWTEEKAGKRVNVARTEQALEVEPSIISSGCPYCLTMLSDGTKALNAEDDVRTYDVAELLELSIIGRKQ
ncbi:hypothetical protein EDM56_26085 [Brevibacillus fluminis]|uniref:4Fe-4S ferredoxin-type domain-containing protein n=1 Tax=Brevibacillus fluminis TaxID=511487 RepID=A0A3M8D1X6_9BACL|nr:(Fe-S)-binding protein [Brevibacillus fluminis]RNB81195.1 hypothetical protein EDM56_26085 [Brevibacillus fluminis]